MPSANPMAATPPEGGGVQSASVGHSACGPVTSSWLHLRTFAEMFEDMQKARIAASNRAQRGGVDPEVYLPALEHLDRAEHVLALTMRREYRRVVPPAVRDWQERSLGIGEHLTARLLGITGHPVFATPHHWEGEGDKRTLLADAPYARTLRQWWSYCGHGDPTRRKRKGMTTEDAFALGSPRAKMVVHLLAESCIKQKTGRYRAVYDSVRLRYLADPDWKDESLGHQHNSALRLVGKEILRDLWIEGGR